ncbi:MAG: FAD-binding oxidoreductase [Alphaproteobacteria bacterium]|nr:FAD-binding oxidoreductase [Alphaproteobacteria bacterium]
MKTREASITVAGAGVLGLWQALTLARRGYRVRLVDRNCDPLANSASSYAGAMIAPYCEAEAAPRVVLEHGLEGLAAWRATYPGLVNNGTLVIASSRDRSDLDHFRRMTQGHANCDAAAIAELEPDLGRRFPAGLYFADEAHMTTPDALSFLLKSVREAGGEVHFGVDLPVFESEFADASGILIDCRGMAARGQLPGLRAVRGERVIVRTKEISLNRPIRLLHPRHPIYVVPWGDQRFMVGATVIESEDAGPICVRSMLELLGTAYALSPAFAEAEIVEAGAGVRPAFDDNVPRVKVEGGGRVLRVNGAYRHGFLLAPVLAGCVAGVLDGSAMSHPLVHVSDESARPLRNAGEVI